MSNSARELLDAAMTLGERERAELAARLIDSLSPGDTDEGYAGAWEAEIQMRCADLDAGRVTGVPWNTARKRILEGDDGGSH
jgi:putative addiction module component (TIGR02574 family)